MGKLYHLLNLYGSDAIDKSICGILTTNDFRTSLWLRENPRQRFPHIIGINSVYQGKPISLGGELYERGLEDPKLKIIYIIDAEKRILRILNNNINLFYDADKVQSENQFVSGGEFQEIIKEFINIGYSIR